MIQSRRSWAHPAQEQAKNVKAAGQGGDPPLTCFLL
jgi:hypothetical protein